MKKNVETLKKLAEELFALMSIPSAKIEVDYDKEQESYIVNVDAPEETGLLIGKKGETLSSIQTVLGVLLKGKVGEWNRVVVGTSEIIREKEEEYLRNLATSTADRAKETGQPQSLYNLKPWQRRIVHMTLSEDSSIETESIGEGEESIFGCQGQIIFSFLDVATRFDGNCLSSSFFTSYPARPTFLAFMGFCFWDKS